LFVVELLFVPVLLGEKPVESAFVASWKDLACGALYGIVVDRGKMLAYALE